MFKLNFDHDIARRVLVDLRPDGAEFRSLPVAEQIKRLDPYIRAQAARDRERLQNYEVAA